MIAAKTFAKETLGADYVPYAAHITGDILRTYAGDYLSVLHLDGLSFDTADIEFLNDRCLAFNNTLRNIGDPAIALWVNVVRGERQAYPEGDFPAGFAAELDQKYAASLVGTKMRVNDIYLTLILHPTNNPLLKFAGLLGGSKESEQAQKAATERLTEIRNDLVASLHRYAPSVLAAYSHEGKQFSGSLEALGRIANGYHQRYPLTPSPIDAMLMTSRLSFGAEVLEIRAPHMRRVGAALGIKEYPSATEPEILNALLSVPFDFVLAQSFVFMPKPKALEQFRRQQVRLNNAGDKALSQIVELTDAMDDLASNRFVAGYHHLSLVVLADSRADLDKTLPMARSVLADAGIIVAREDLGLESAYWSLLPANFRYRLRPSQITSRNFAGFANFHNYPTGKEAGNHWGPALALLKTRSGAPYYLSLHVGDLGTSHINGPSGSGKTVLQGFLLAQLQKFGPRQVFFDKDRGAEILIRALKGSYLPLQMGKPTGLAPFKALEPSAANLLFLEQLVRKLAVSDGKSSLSPQEEKSLQAAVRDVMRLSSANRSLSSLLSFLDNTDANGLSQRLSKWCQSTGGAYAWVLDNDVDTLSFDNHLVGFDVTEFLEAAIVRTPVIMYIFQRIEALITGERLAIFMDEFWRLLEDAYFLDFAQNKLKTIRKQNGFLVTGTQSPRDTLNSKIAHTIIEQSPTQIFMPNPRAQEADYIHGFKLTRREFELVSRELVDTRHFLLKQGHDSVVATLDLNGMSDELAVLSGTTANVALVNDIIAEVGPDPAVWLPIFHARRK